MATPHLPWSKLMLKVNSYYDSAYLFLTSIESLPYSHLFTVWNRLGDTGILHTNNAINVHQGSQLPLHLWDRKIFYNHALQRKGFSKPKLHTKGRTLNKATVELPGQKNILLLSWMSLTLAQLSSFLLDLLFNKLSMNCGFFTMGSKFKKA